MDIMANIKSMWYEIACNNQQNEAYYELQVNKIGPNGEFKFEDNIHCHCDVVIPWYLVFCGDLKIRNKWCNQAMTVGSTYPHPQALKIDTSNEIYALKSLVTL